MKTSLLILFLTLLNLVAEANSAMKCVQLFSQNETVQISNELIEKTALDLAALAYSIDSEKAIYANSLVKKAIESQLNAGLAELQKQGKPALQLYFEYLADFRSGVLGATPEEILTARKQQIEKKEFAKQDLKNILEIPLNQEAFRLAVHNANWKLALELLKRYPRIDVNETAPLKWIMINGRGSEESIELVKYLLKIPNLDVEATSNSPGKTFEQSALFLAVKLGDLEISKTIFSKMKFLTESRESVIDDMYMLAHESPAPDLINFFKSLMPNKKVSRDKAQAAFDRATVHGHWDLVYDFIRNENVEFDKSKLLIEIIHKTTGIQDQHVKDFGRKLIDLFMSDSSIDFEALDSGRLTALDRAVYAGDSQLAQHIYVRLKKPSDQMRFLQFLEGKYHAAVSSGSLELMNFFKNEMPHKSLNPAFSDSVYDRAVMYKKWNAAIQIFRENKISGGNRLLGLSNALKAREQLIQKKQVVPRDLVDFIDLTVDHLENFKNAGFVDRDVLTSSILQNDLTTFEKLFPLALKEKDDPEKFARTIYLYAVDVGNPTILHYLQPFLSEGLHSAEFKQEIFSHATRSRNWKITLEIIWDWKNDKNLTQLLQPLAEANLTLDAIRQNGDAKKILNLVLGHPSLKFDSLQQGDVFQLLSFAISEKKIDLIKKIQEHLELDPFYSATLKISAYQKAIKSGDQEIVNYFESIVFRDSISSVFKNAASHSQWVILLKLFKNHKIPIHAGGTDFIFNLLKTGIYEPVTQESGQEARVLLNYLLSDPTLDLTAYTSIDRSPVYISILYRDFSMAQILFNRMRLSEVAKSEFATAIYYHAISVGDDTAANYFRGLIK